MISQEYLHKLFWIIITFLIAVIFFKSTKQLALQKSNENAERVCNSEQSDDTEERNTSKKRVSFRGNGGGKYEFFRDNIQETSLNSDFIAGCGTLINDIVSEGDPPVAHVDGFIHRLHCLGLRVDVMDNNNKVKGKKLRINSKGTLRWFRRSISNMVSDSIFDLKEIFQSKTKNEYIVMEFLNGRSVHFKLRDSEFPLTQLSVILYFDKIIKMIKTDPQYIQNILSTKSQSFKVDNEYSDDSDSDDDSVISYQSNKSPFSDITRTSVDSNFQIVLSESMKTLTEFSNLSSSPSPSLSRKHTLNQFYDLSLLPIAYGEFKPYLSIENVTEVNHLADGSNSNIYQARRIETNKVIILKVMKDSSKSPSNVVIKEFERELLVLSRAQHTHIVNILGSGKLKSEMNENFMRPFIALELLSGNSLTYHLKLPRTFSILPFTKLRYLRIAKELADALYYLHEKFHTECLVIHRDMKPDNIGFTSEGVLKLMDFGLSVCIKKNSTDDGLYRLSGTLYLIYYYFINLFYFYNA